MLEIEYYDVRINSSEGEEVSERIDNATTLLFELFNGCSKTTFTINITVVDFKEQRSNSTITIKTICMENMICSKWNCDS